VAHRSHPNLQTTAGQEIGNRKLPFEQNCRPMFGSQTIADATSSTCQRRLGRNSVAAPKLNSRSAHFAIKLPAISDVCNAHEPVGRWVLRERLFMAGSARSRPMVP